MYIYIYTIVIVILKICVITIRVLRYSESIGRRKRALHHRETNGLLYAKVHEINGSRPQSADWFDCLADDSIISPTDFLLS